MSADSRPPKTFVARVFWLGRCFGAPSVLVAPGWLWGSGGVESWQALTSGSCGPRLHSAGLPSRPGRKEALQDAEVATLGTLQPSQEDTLRA